ncbi:MarR family transcriptional regulator [Halobacteriovorax vibrionivorans]|uniref:MarR family transcriptional regulator n=1 Tax=Halobacteriovorax vibrionivorans TaxID=2152716 RepID=A0ABY0IK32_9BACT|nr:MULTISPECIES: MarR family transcriptional regulator [Halobacteriovorax]RZF22201.1 MarR family transcriptional regulator [Halobacteriovorax vibrionivorans]TGD48453.1 MarR family transcriptional regulator [Halobacteriovorax sp. Y22]
MSIVTSNALKDSIIARIVRTTRIIDKMVSEEVGQYKLTKPQFDVLLVLKFCNQDYITTTELSEELMVSKANITGIVTRLEKANLISKIVDENDTRSKKIALTESGLELIDRVMPRYFAMSDEIYSKFSEEERQKLLSQMIFIEEFYNSRR